MATTEDKELTAMKTAYAALAPLKDDALNRAFQWLAQKLTRSVVAGPIGKPGVPGLREASGGAASAGGGGVPKPKDFLSSKKSANFQERMACLAYYLTHYRNIPKYKTLDLTNLNTEAVQPKMSNPAVFARNAVNCQYLSLAGGGAKQITARGEAVVEALPDREAVKKALKDHPLIGRKKKKKKKGTKASAK